MNIIQTLYINKSKDTFNDTFGWVRPEFHLMSWALSCLQLNELYGNVELYANSGAAKLLIDVLELPYNNVKITHDNLDLANDKLWALPKIYTYSLQEEPFLHFDGDVFVFERFTDALFNSELIAQNIEVATDYYISTQKELVKYFAYFPKCVKADFDSRVPIKAVNAGILGGNNISFIKEYASEAFEYINRNIDYLSSINVDRFNVFFEQHLFYSLAKERNVPINFLFTNVINDNGYKFLGNFHEVPKHRGYLHLLGHFKRDEFTCLQMATKLRELYPEYYYRIISNCKRKNIQLIHSFYYNERLENNNDFQNLQEKAKKCYQNKLIKINSLNEECECIELLNENSDLCLLNEIFNIYVEIPDKSLDKVKLKNDFVTFSESLVDVLKGNSQISNYYLYGRDIDSVNWYGDIFSNELELRNKIICQSEELNIIESEFDWAGLMNKHKRSGIEYYLNLTLVQGQFFNLVVPEVSQHKFSLFDIYELEKLILECLTQPLSIKDLLLEMQYYVEDDVIQNHLESYNTLIIELIEQLVLKKAIRSVN